jgi:dUTP pyrophosphatase
MNLNIKKLNENITLPFYGSAFAAGLDVCSSDDYIVAPRSRIVVSTGISISWEGEDCNNYYLRVAPRSGLSVKNNIDIGAGVIDSDYRGEIKVCFINNDNEKEYIIKKGDKVAQLILEKINRFININEVTEHSETERGSDGFGSTGR